MEEKRAIEQVAKTTKLVDGRYEVGLPWVEDEAIIQNNYFSAQSQFCSLDRRLLKDEILQQRYEETIKMDLQNAHAPKIEEKKLNETKDDRQ